MAIFTSPGSPRLGWLPPTPKRWQRMLAEAERARLPLPPARALGRPGHSIRAALGDKWYVLGKTKTGKTTFTKRLIIELRKLYPFLKTYIYDSKQAEGDFTGWPGVVEQDEPPAPLRTPGAIQIWRPQYDDFTAIDAWFEGILKGREPAHTVIDELSSLAKSPIRPDYPINMARMQKQGAGLGQILTMLTQEAAYNPRAIKTQASHLVRFGLQEDEHAASQAARLLGHAEPREPRAAHGFFHRDLDSGGPAYEYDSYRDFF